MSSVAHLVEEILAYLGAFWSPQVATPKSITYQVITLEPKQVQNSQRVQIIALLINFNKGVQDLFALVNNFRDAGAKTT